MLAATRLSRSGAPADTPLFYALLVLFAWLPLPLGSNRPWSVAFMAVVTLAIALLWLLQYLRGRVALSEPLLRAWPLVAALALLVLWVNAQAWALPLPVLEALSPAALAIHGPLASHPSLSLDAQATREAALTTLCYTLIFCLTLLLVTSRQRMKLLILVVVFSGLFQAAYGSLMTLSGLEYGFFSEKYAYLGVATGTFVNRNHLAGYLEMSLALGIGLLLAELATRNAANWRDSARRLLRSLFSTKVLVRLALAIMVIGLVLTHSRMGNGAFFASLTITGLLYLAATRRLTRGGILFFASLLLIDLLIVGNFFGVEQVVERLQDTSATAENRDEMTRDTLVMIRDYPVTGVGVGSFYSAYPRYGSEEVYRLLEHAHNDYAEFAAEFGLPAFALLGLVVLLALKSSLTALFRRRDTFMRGMGFAATMGIVAILIHSAVDFNLHVPANAALFMVLLAVAVLSEHFDKAAAR